MKRNRRILLVLAALSGLTSVALGAFAAHGVADPQAQAWLKTGANYQIVHTLAVFAALTALPRDSRPGMVAATLFVIGALIFSGTLYAMALGAPRWLGAITPVGGLALMAGWIALAWGAFRLDDNRL